MTDYIEVHIKEPVNDRLLHSLFVTACEGGINYWAYFDEYHWRKKNAPPEASMEESEDVLGFKAVIGIQYPDEGEEGTDIVIDRAVILKGLTQAFKELGTIGNEYYNKSIRDCVLNPEEADFDATVADVIVQYGLFGEVVYG